MSPVAVATSIRDLTEPLLAQLPAPAPELDAIIDATIACFTRHGPTRTSVTDIARVLGVTRATVYRNGGSVMQLANLVTGRELRRHLESLPPEILDRGDARAVIAFAVETVNFYNDHPVIQKVRADEPALLGKLVCQSYPRSAAALTGQLTAFVAASMADGRLHDGDPALVAETYLRLCVLAVAVPPLTSVADHLEAALGPMLLPDGIGA